MPQPISSTAQSGDTARPSRTSAARSFSPEAAKASAESAAVVQM